MRPRSRSCLSTIGERRTSWGRLRCGIDLRRNAVVGDDGIEAGATRAPRRIASDASRWTKSRPRRGLIATTWTSESSRMIATRRRAWKVRAAKVRGATRGVRKEAADGVASVAVETEASARTAVSGLNARNAALNEDRNASENAELNEASVLDEASERSEASVWSVANERNEASAPSGRNVANAWSEASGIVASAPSGASVRSGQAAANLGGMNRLDMRTTLKRLRRLGSSTTRSNWTRWTSTDCRRRVAGTRRRGTRTNDVHVVAVVVVAVAGGAAKAVRLGRETRRCATRRRRGAMTKMTLSRRSSPASAAGLILNLWRTKSI